MNFFKVLKKNIENCELVIHAAAESHVDNSIKNLEFIVKEYKRLIDDFIENSANQ